MTEKYVIKYMQCQKKFKDHILKFEMIERINQIRMTATVADSPFPDWLNTM